MKKGQKVRVLADNRVGIVADSHFINWGGKRLVQLQVKFPNTKGEAPWFPAEQLTASLVERTTIAIKGEKGSLNLTFTNNHDKHTSQLSMTGEPEDLTQHKGTHAMVAAAFLQGLRKMYDLQPVRETVIQKF